MLRDSVKLLISTIEHMRDMNQLFFIPLTVWSGLEQSFLGVKFIKGFVSCTLNAKYVGLVLIAYDILFVENDEVAFSNSCLWESIGFVLFYIITPYIRIRIALVILTIFLTLGMTGYGLTEYRWKKTKDNQVIPL